MDVLTLTLIILLILVLAGGGWGYYGYRGGPYPAGWGWGGGVIWIIVLVLLIWLLLGGHSRVRAEPLGSCAHVPFGSSLSQPHTLVGVAAPVTLVHAPMSQRSGAALFEVNHG